MPTRPPPTDHEPQQEVPASAALVRRALGLVALVVVLALVVSLLPGLEDVRERFHRADPGWLAVTFACVLASTLSYVAALRGTRRAASAGARAGRRRPSTYCYPTGTPRPASTTR